MSPAMRSHARFPLALLLVATLLCLATSLAPPAGRLNWLLEVGPGLAGVFVLIAVYSRFPLSHWFYGCAFLHLLILIYGGYYTYAETPLGDWVKEAFDLSRNHYDRVGHVALGVFPAFYAREILRRTTPLREGGWFFFIILSVVLAIAAFWEILEWWVAVLVAPDVGQAFLGSQGDQWDAQWDMFLALAGAAAALLAAGGLHDRSIVRIPASGQ